MNPLKSLLPVRFTNLFIFTDRSTSTRGGLERGSFYSKNSDHSNLLLSPSVSASPASSSFSTGTTTTAREQQQQPQQLPSDLIVVEKPDTPTRDIDNTYSSSSFNTSVSNSSKSSLSSDSSSSPKVKSSNRPSQSTFYCSNYILPPNMVSENNRNQLYSNNYNNMNHNINNNNNNNNNNQSARVLGVILTSDRLNAIQISTAVNNALSTLPNDSTSSLTILESIVLDKDIDCCTCDELRRLIISQLPSAPKKFAFLTKDGWPVSQGCESRLGASQVVHDSNHIKIKQAYEKPKIGIEERGPIGFVFSDISANLMDIRGEINKVLSEIAGPEHDRMPDYSFIDRNGWPVLKTQEENLITLDLLCSQVIRIRFDRPMRPNSLPNKLRAINGSLDGNCSNTNLGNNHLGSPHSTSLSPINLAANDNLSLPNQNVWNSNVDGMISIRENTTEVNEVLKRRGSKKGSSIVRTFSKRKSDKVIRIKSSTQTTHSIMLSYARAEGADHALNLKMELRKLNISVYLDVHEIGTGTDWQDSLNNAVSNCVMFVPLVTPMYGNTQWTNREVKLADVLEKKIVPINFLDTWPPECLAIQFATTQYINWLNGRDTIDSPHTDTPLDGIKLWPKVCIKKIAKTLEIELNKCLKENKSKVKSITNNPPIDTTSTAITSSLCYSTIDSPPGDSRLVVILVHPKEYHIAKKIRDTLEKEEYLVWCSCDNSPLLGASEDPGPKTFHNAVTPTAACLPAIPEGEVSSVLPENYQAYAKFLVQSSKARPKSMPPIDASSSDTADTIDSGVSPGNFSIGDSCPIKSSHTNDLITINSTQSLVTLGTRPKQLTRMNSQLSDVSQHSSLMTETDELLKLFRAKVNMSRAVIVIVSDNYLTSSTSKQQLFYCESRKKMIIVDAGVTQPFQIYTNLMRGKITVKSNDFKFADSIKSQVRRIMDPNATDTSAADVWYEAKINYCVRMMRDNMDYIQKCVYIFGSTNITDARTREICREIGTALAKVNNLTLVTSGYTGAQDLVAKSFLEAIQGTFDEDGVEASKSRIVHVLPSKAVKSPHAVDSQADGWCSQVADGSFEPMSYGRTLFIGDTRAEQNTVLFRLLDTAILIQGDQTTAREVEEFIWNDHFVIPVISTGGAASGHVNISFKVFERPNCVDAESWAAMSDKTLPPADVAKAIVNIVIETKQHIASMHLTGNKKFNNRFKSKLRKSSKKKVTIDKIEFDKTGSNVTLNTGSILPIDNGGNSSPEKSLPIIEMDPIKNSSVSKWKRVQKMFAKGC